jgi:hypothetical protein
MRYLADACDFPTILVVQGMTDITFDHTAWINPADRLQTKRTAVFLHDRKLYPGSTPEGVSSL